MECLKISVLIWNRLKLQKNRNLKTIKPNAENYNLKLKNLKNKELNFVID